MRVLTSWILNAFSGLTALLGALLVGWNLIEIYYLSTGRVHPDFEQPSLGVVILLLIFGLILLFGGWGLQRWLKKSPPS